ncbi:MAG: sensor histidine kinase [Pseudomonadota bacterium]
MRSVPSASEREPAVPSAVGGLSGRLLWITVLLVLLGEVLIYVPSISRFRVVYLTERLATAHLATTLLLAGEAAELDVGLERGLLDQAGMRAIRVEAGDRVLALGDMVDVDATYRLAEESVPTMIRNAFTAMLGPRERVIRVIGPSPADPGVTVDIVLDERPMCAEMVAYSGRILQLSLFLSALVAGSLFLWLQLLIVRPLRDLTATLMAFRRNPEDPDALTPPSARHDELGVVQREMRRMQSHLSEALRQRERLAALGAAVGKINHDLRNVLASAMLLSDRLEASADPKVRKIAPRLLHALERATGLCAETLAFARAEPPPPLNRRPTPLRPLLETAAEQVPGFGEGWTFVNHVADEVRVKADPDQLARVFENLFANAATAMAERGGTLRVAARKAEGDVLVEVADTGPGLPEAVRVRLFEPFVGGGRKNGTGLGLHIAREVTRRHGGELTLDRTGPEGTTFLVRLPAAEGVASDLLGQSHAG